MKKKTKNLVTDSILGTLLFLHFLMVVFTIGHCLNNKECEFGCQSATLLSLAPTFGLSWTAYWSWELQHD